MLLFVPSVRAEELSIVDLIEEANRFCTSKQTSTCETPAKRPTSKGSGAAVVGAATGASEGTGLPRERVTIKDLHGRDLAVDAIPEDRIRELRGLFPSHLRVYDDEVCSQRAHIVGDTLARHGIESVKLVLQPGWFGHIIPDNRVRSSRGVIPHWKYHVVNMVYVRKANGQLEEYIIDPFMESYPVPRSKWEQRLRTNPRSSIGSIDVASRYVLDHDDLNRQDLSYDNEVLQRSYAIMRGEPKR